MLLKPQPLSQNATVGVIAPSLPLIPAWRPAYESGLSTLRSLGFHVKEGRTIGLQRWWSAGTAQQQADDINAMFADPEVKAIFALNGGFSALAVLPYIDYEQVARNPKPFVGMSDITQYQLAMLGKTGLIGFHGNDVINGFGGHFSAAQPAWQQTILQTYRRLLMVNEPLGVLPRSAERTCWRPGSATGRLIGGNLKRITPLIGTSFFPALDWFDGAILFWEEIGETLYDITLNLHLLKHVGILERISGMIVGELTWVNQYFEEIEHPTPREAILDTLSDFDFPILKVSDFGHNMTMLPLPMGVQATVDAEAQQVTILESAVSS